MSSLQIAYLNDVELAALIRSQVPGPIGSKASEFIAIMKVSGHVFKELTQGDLDVLSEHDPEITRTYLQLQGKSPCQRHYSLHSVYPTLDFTSHRNARSSLSATAKGENSNAANRSIRSRLSSPQFALDQLDRPTLEDHPGDTLCDHKSLLEPTQTIQSTNEPTGAQLEAVVSSLIPESDETSSREVLFGSSVLDPVKNGDFTCYSSSISCSNGDELQNAIPLHKITPNRANFSGTSPSDQRTDYIPDDMLSQGDGPFSEPSATSTVLLPQEHKKGFTDLEFSPTSELSDPEYTSPLLGPCGVTDINGADLAAGNHLLQHEAALTGHPSISSGPAHQTPPNIADDVYNVVDSVMSTKALPQFPAYDSIHLSTGRPLSRRSLTPTWENTLCSPDVAPEDLEGALDIADSDSEASFGLTALLRLPSPALSGLNLWDIRSESASVYEAPALEDDGINGEISLETLRSMGSGDSALSRHTSVLALDSDCGGDKVTYAEKSPVSQGDGVAQSLDQPRSRFSDSEQENVSPPFLLSPLPRAPSLSSTLENDSRFSPIATFGPPPFPEHVFGQAHVTGQVDVNSSPGINHRHMASNELGSHFSLSRQGQLNCATNLSLSLDGSHESSECANNGFDVFAYSPLHLDIPESSLSDELSTISPLFSPGEFERDYVKHYAGIRPSQCESGDRGRTITRIDAQRTLWPTNPGYHEPPISRRDVTPGLEPLTSEVGVKSNVEESREAAITAAHDIAAGTSSQIEFTPRSWWGRLKEAIFFNDAEVVWTHDPPPAEEQASD
ncbi:hypothetical protein D9615_005765 [Tricholomella constricta]|uniref:Uncharacterized protein n=1 Tax=Tricholomella constricta TaxID=117010 RepID=A0A8H5M3Y8_9AGAR|nr:hypothetical protein D9615_005765 [Tricholomella constricta]